MADAQHSARALWEVGALAAFVTTTAFCQDRGLPRLLRAYPSRWSESLNRQLMRRSISEVPTEVIHSHPFWEIVRTLTQKSGAKPTIVDTIWDFESRRFGVLVARRYLPQSDLVQCFEYVALECFKAASVRGIARVLNLPALDYAAFNEVQKRERSLWPELTAPDDEYFDRKFAKRQERRAQEIALADVIICNSTLTARSHIQGGADPAKTFVVPLGAPTPIATIADDRERSRRALRAMYAGPFSLRKGAHYLLQAWHKLNPGSAATLEVYGVQSLPERLIAQSTDSIIFHGSVTRSTLYAAYEQADVLVFPTLSDGFGLVVTEALAHGCPVITTDQAGAADLITADNGRIVPAADPDALTNALRWCLDNRARLADMRQHALDSARRRQWSDFRRDLIANLDIGLRRRGYAPKFVPSLAERI